MAFVFIFIDYYLKRSTRKGYVLIGLGIYSTFYLTLKTILATLYHFRFYFEKCCCSCCHPKLEDEYRRTALRKYWGDLSQS